MNVRLAVTLARGGLAANRLRLALTVACIALGVALAAAVHTIHTSALAEIDRAAHALAGAADLEVRGPRNGFDDAVFLAVAAHPDVAAASPVLEVEAPLAGRDGTLRLLGIDPFRALRLQPAFVGGAHSASAAEAGSLLDPRHAWLTPPALARLGVQKGEAFRVLAGTEEVEFIVAGLLPGLADAGDVAVIDIAAAQARFGRLGLLSRIDVRLRTGVDAAAFERDLAPTLGAGIVVSRPASISGRAASISRAYRVNLDALALIALATGAFLVFSTLALQAARRRQEFALLLALGVTRRGLSALLALEGGLVGALGAVAGIALGLAGSRAMLERVGADLGAGYFGTTSQVFAPDPFALAAIGMLGIGTAIVAALWVGRSVARIPVAEALRDRTVDLPAPTRHAAAAAGFLALGGVPLLFAPPVAGLPLGGYAAIGLWLLAAVLAVEPACRKFLDFGGRSASRDADRWSRSPLASLAIAQVRLLPGHLAASIAGIVMSMSLCVAMAIMVYSFRASLADWLDGVVGADLYVRTASGGDTGHFSEGQQRAVAALPEVASIEALRFDRLVLDGDGAPLSLIARPIHKRILRGFRATPSARAPTSEPLPVWISEAARDLQGWKPGDRIALPIAGRHVPVEVMGIIRDYARTWGAVMIDIEAYRRLSGDARANDLAVHLAPGVEVAAAESAIRQALPGARGVEFEDAVALKRRSLAIFDRSFAVTYALEAIAIVIGLTGVTSSFAALAWSRRREFGVLRFLGLRRAEVLRLLALEGLTTGAIGAALGLATGIAVSLVLIHVVNRQSFHWTLEVHWPVAGLAALLSGVIALCAIGARSSAALAVRHEAILAVKDDA